MSSGKMLATFAVTSVLSLVVLLLTTLPQEGASAPIMTPYDQPPAQHYSVFPEARSEVRAIHQAVEKENSESSGLVLPGTQVNSGNSFIGATEVEIGVIELTLSSETAFPITGSLPVLTIGGVVEVFGSVQSNTNRISFWMSEEMFASLEGGEEVIVEVSSSVWDFGEMPTPSSILQESS